MHLGYWNLHPIVLQILIFADDLSIAETPERLQQTATEWN